MEKTEIARQLTFVVALCLPGISHAVNLLGDPVTLSKHYFTDNAHRNFQSCV